MYGFVEGVVLSQNWSSIYAFRCYMTICALVQRFQGACPEFAWQAKKEQKASADLEKSQSKQETCLAIKAVSMKRATHEKKEIKNCHPSQVKIPSTPHWDFIFEAVSPVLSTARAGDRLQDMKDTTAALEADTAVIKEVKAKCAAMDTDYEKRGNLAKSLAKPTCQIHFFVPKSF